jgi:hypothetical protein
MVRVVSEEEKSEMLKEICQAIRDTMREKEREENGNEEKKTFFVTM